MWRTRVLTFLVVVLSAAFAFSEVYPPGTASNLAATVTGLASGGLTTIYGSAAADGDVSVYGTSNADGSDSTLTLGVKAGITRFSLLGDGTSNWTSDGTNGVSLDASGDLTPIGTGTIKSGLLATASVPATDDDACTTGATAYDATHFYICTDGAGAPKWHRVAWGAAW